MNRSHPICENICQGRQARTIDSIHDLRIVDSWLVNGFFPSDIKGSFVHRGRCNNEDAVFVCFKGKMLLTREVDEEDRIAYNGMKLFYK